MPEIEFHERIDKSVAVGVHIGGRVVVMSPEEWLETARDIVAKVEAHLTQRPPDGLTPGQSEQVRQMIQNALDTGSA